MTIQKEWQKSPNFDHFDASFLHLPPCILYIQVITILLQYFLLQKLNNGRMQAEAVFFL